MPGALLRSGKNEAFDALGETGAPVYRSALQLREAIKRRAANMAQHLAIPQSNQAGDHIDWYAPFDGPVIPWTSATEEERVPARNQLMLLKAELVRLSEELIHQESAGNASDKVIFAKLLKQVLRFPDESFVYLVNGTPVVTFWGFDHPQGDRDRDPLHCLYPPVAASTPPSIAPLSAPGAPAMAPLAAAPVSAAWWRRWWVFLPLLLLLLFALLFGLRACAPQLGLSLPGVTLKTPSVSNLSLSGVDLKAPSLPRLPQPSANIGMRALAGVTAGSDPGGSRAPVAAPAGPDPAAAIIGRTPEAPAAMVDPAVPPVLSMPEADPVAPLSASNAVASPPDAGTAVVPPVIPEALIIPSGASNGTADFLNGQWRAGSGIQDSRTGKSLRLEYQFDNGKGNVTVSRADGVACSGPVAASMKDGALAIASGGPAACADGGQYELPQVVCQQGANNTADCSGNYGNKQFPLSMRQASQ